MKPMNILFISPYLIDKKSLGGMIRYTKFIEFLKHRHNIHVICLNNRNQSTTEPVLLEGVNLNIINTKKPHLLKKVYNRLCRIEPSIVTNCYIEDMINTIKRSLVKYNIELIHFEFSYIGKYVQFIDRNKYVSILVEQEVNFRRLKREIESNSCLLGLPWLYIDYIKFKNYETRIYKYFDCIFAITQEEKKAILSENSNLQVDIYPNVVNVDYFNAVTSQYKEPYSLIFVGNYLHKPNETGVLWFVNNVFPTIKEKFPHTKFYIVGANLSNKIKKLANDKNIIVTGFVDDIRPYLHKCSIFVNPIITGGGMRGKILEAMACKLPVISTPIGAEGMIIRNNENILIVNSHDEFAKETIRLLKNKNLRYSIGEKGFYVVKENYDETKVFTKMEQKYEELIKNKKRQ